MAHGDLRGHRRLAGAERLDRLRSHSDRQALLHELGSGAAELELTRARVRAAVVDPLDAELRVARGAAAADELRTGIEVPVNQAAVHAVGRRLTG